MAWSYEKVCEICAGWPGVTAAQWYGTDGLKVGGKGFARYWSEKEHNRDDVHDTAVLVVMSDVEEKSSLIEAAGGVLFETPHYEGHGAMLVRLADASRELLEDCLEDAYRQKASPKLLVEFDTLD